MSTNKDQFRFWRKWTLTNALILIIAYPVSMIIGLAFFTNPGYEWGTHFEQTRDVIIFQSVAGFILGTAQWLLLRKFFSVSLYWIFSIPFAVIFFESIAGIILWKLDINRGDLSFLEGDPYSHALILAITGLIVGIIQLPLLKKYFSRIIYWVVASMFAWSISVLITAIGHKYDTMVLITFVIGSLLYGAITGTTLTYVMKKKIS